MLAKFRQRKNASPSKVVSRHVDFISNEEMIRDSIFEIEIFVKSRSCDQLAVRKLIMAFLQFPIAYRAKGTQLQSWSREALCEKKNFSPQHFFVESTDAPSERKEQLVANLSRTDDFCGRKIQ